MRQYYAPGLYVDYTERESSKIEEIKARPERPTQESKLIPWDEKTQQEVARIETKRKMIQAIALLSDCGIDVKTIADLFGIGTKKARYIIRTRAMGGEI